MRVQHAARSLLERLIEFQSTPTGRMKTLQPGNYRAWPWLAYRSHWDISPIGDRMIIVTVMQHLFDKVGDSHIPMVVVEQDCRTTICRSTVLALVRLWYDNCHLPTDSSWASVTNSQPTFVRN